jgi:hypothetical protein
MFGLSKLWTWVIAVVVALAAATALYLVVLQHGENLNKAKVNAHNVEVVETARKADDKAIVRLIDGTRTIEIHTNEVKEVVHEVAPTGINDVSFARLERVRQQQGLVREERSDAKPVVTDVSSGTFRSQYPEK